MAKLEGEIEFTCTDCGKKYRVVPGYYPWSYGYKKISSTRVVCRTCYAEYRKKRMLNDGEIALRIDLEKQLVHDLPDSDLHFRIGYVRDAVKSAWGNTSSAYLIRFIGPDGKVWSGSCGKWNNSCSFRRLKIKPENIAKG